MKKFILVTAVALTVSTSFAQEAAPSAELGMNLAELNDWSTAYPLVDLFKSARPWISQKGDGSWSRGPKLELDEHGWIKKLESGCSAEVPMFSESPGTMPVGDYVILYDGKGTLQTRNANVVSEEPGRIVVRVDKTSRTFWISIHKTDPNDYIRNIRLILPGFEDTHQKDRWNPQFLERWKGVACLRFMDWMHTNGSKIETWAERPEVNDMSYSGTHKGVPLDVMIDLCNRLETDAWFCMPHLADKEYVQTFAEMVQEKLNPDLKVYVEYSNEVWNSMFRQTKDNTARATELGLGNKQKPWEGNGLLYAQRAVELGKIWHDVFDDDSRIVRVIAWQCNPWWIEKILFRNPDIATGVDALAIAPYITLNLPKAPANRLTADEAAKWTEDQVLDHMQTVRLPEAVKHIREIGALAKANNLKLIAYEGGQHMVGLGPAMDNQVLETLLKNCNRNPRMADIYRDYFNVWTETGGSLFCYFGSTARWSKYGSWGILESYNAAPTPKYRAIIEWAQQCGQNMSIQDNSK